MKENLTLLQRFKYKLTKQQFKTFKGQILAGDYEGFKKGLKKVLNIKSPSEETIKEYKPYFDVFIKGFKEGQKNENTK